MSDPIQFQVRAKVTDAVFTCEEREPREYRLKVLLKVYAAIGRITLIDGETRETEVPFPFQTEEDAEKYAVDKAREFKLSECRYTDSKGRSFSIETRTEEVEDEMSEEISGAND